MLNEMIVDLLRVHKGVQPTVYVELLMGLTTLSLTPPTTFLGSRILSRPTTIGNSVDTEIVYGQGEAAEYFADMGGYDG